MKKRIGPIGTVDENAEKEIIIEKHGAFTQTYNAKMPCSMAYVLQGDKSVIVNSARWDTGSQYTYIDHSCASGLKPEPELIYGAIGINGQTQDGPGYYVTLVLPGGIRLLNVPVGSLDFSHLRECDAVIGMDIISQGKLTVSRDSFSFEI